MSKSLSFALTLNILWFSLSTCYDKSVIHYASHRTEHASFLTNISQGSVATHSRCGGIVNDRCAANFLGIVTVEEFLKIGQYLTKLCVEHLVFTFFGPSCTLSHTGCDENCSSVSKLTGRVEDTDADDTDNNDSVDKRHSVHCCSRSETS